VRLEGPRDFSAESLKPFAQRLEILVRIAHAELLARTMLAGDRDRCRSDQLLRQRRPHLVAAVITESRHDRATPCSTQ